MEKASFQQWYRALIWSVNRSISYRYHKGSIGLADELDELFEEIEQPRRGRRKSFADQPQEAVSVSWLTIESPEREVIASLFFYFSLRSLDKKSRSE